MPNQIYLQWNNHKSLLSQLKNFLRKETMVDVTLACDGKILKAHQLILSACSPYFQAMFKNNPCKHPIVILANMKYEHLEAIIQFIYHGEVNVCEDQLDGLFEIATFLQVKVLGEVLLLNSYRSSENRPTDEYETQFVDDSENVFSDATVYQLESTTRVTSPEKKSRSSSSVLQKTSVEENIASDSEIDFEDSAFSSIDEILEANELLEQQLDEESGSEISAVEKDPEHPKEIPQKQTSAENPPGCSPSKLVMNQQHESSLDDSVNTSYVPCLRPSFVVLQDIMALLPESEKRKYLQDIPKKKIQNKIKLELPSREPAVIPIDFQKFLTKDSADSSTPRKVLSKIDNAGSSDCEKKYKCKSCSYRSAFNKSVERHFLAKHLKVRNWKCDQCSYAGVLKQRLLRHIADIHEKSELRYLCTLCPYKTSQSANLKRHFENIHENKKPYQCDECDFVSAHKACLVKHKVGIHERTRPFLCDFCTYRCSAKDNLRRHVYLRHGIKSNARKYDLNKV